MTLEEQLIPKYNVDEYQLWKGDWELWEGSPVAMSPSSFAKHGSVTAQIVTALNTAVDAAQCNASVIVAVDWIVSSDTVVRPDVTVVCGAIPEKHIMESPSIAIEVLSPSTRNNDLGFKRGLYEEQQVPWYLILDPENERLAVLSIGSSGKYEEVATPNKTEPLKISICDDCELEIAIDRLFV